MAARFDGGVKWYSRGTATVQVFFPEGEIVCQNCKLLTAEYLLKRSRCAVTGEIIPDPTYMTGGLCPLKFEQNNNEKGE